MAVKRKGLGRGLDALLGASAEAAPADELRRVPIDLLDRARYQPRQDVRADSLKDLADSIRVQGVVQPIVVRPKPGGTAGPARYEIIAGERRWRAAQMAGLREIPAIVRDVPDQSAVAMALIENIQRENLNPLEEARALERLVNEFDMTHQQAAEAVGRSRAAVSNLLRLLDLGDEVRALVEARELEMGHARALLALPTRKQQLEVGRLVAKKGLSVRETEQLVRRLLRGARTPKPEAATTDPDVRRLETELSEKLGARVSLRHTARGKGRLIVPYNSLDELDGILAHIK